MRRRAVPVGVAATILALACVSLKRTPEARFFVLRSVVELPASAASASRHGLIGVMPVRLPGHLDRPQVVTWVAPGELRIDEFLRWGEPLDSGFTRTLAENLQALLPEHAVIRPPWRSSLEPRCRVATEIRIFGLQAGGAVRLEGRWVLLPSSGDRPLAARSFSFSRGPLPAGPAGVDPSTEIDAMSELVADLAREVAVAIRALPAAESAEPSGDARPDA